MALSGSFNTSAYGSRYLTFSWTATQSTSANESYISWELKGAGGTTTSYYYSAPFTVVIDGETVYYSESRIQLFNGTTVASGTKTIKHNTNGSRAFSASVSAAIYTFAVNVSGSGSWTLNPIARGAEIVSAPNFTDEDNPTITYSNPAGSSVSKIEACISFDGSTPDINYRAIDMNSSEYTFQLTDSERQILQNGTLNGDTSRTVYFYLRTTIGSTTILTKSNAKTLTIVNCVPEINPTVYDGGIISKTLTGDTSKVIKGYNTMNVAINATPKKGASIVSYSITCGSSSLSTSSGQMANVESGTFVFSCTDNRGITRAQEIELELIPYIKPTISLEASGELDADTNAIVITLNMEGQCWLGDFGATYNQLSIQRRIKSGSDDWSEWVGIGTVSTDTLTSYDTTAIVAGLDYQQSHTVQVRITDSIYTDGVLSDEIVINITPVFDWGSEDFSFNVPVYIQGNLLADYPIEVGTSSMGSNGIWYWRKWKSGKAECYGVRNYGNMAVSNAWGSWYESAAFSQTLPSGLFNTPPEYVDITVNKASGGLIAIQGNGTPTTTKTGDFYLVRATAATITQVYISFNVIGRWK